MEAIYSKEKGKPVSEIFYPESDGQPMADNTKQFQWIMKIQGSLDSMFSKNTDVFVAGDLFWYPVEGDNKIRVAPDVMVAFGRPKGDRSAYLQWKEDNIPPQVVFEILSPGNTGTEMLKKQDFYAKYGVQEYYIYDPDHNLFAAYLRKGKFLQVQTTSPTWRSPLLDVQFELLEDTLKIYDNDGKPFLTYVERTEEAKKAEEKAKKAEEKAKKAEEEKIKAKEEENKALSEKEEEINYLKALLKKSGYNEGKD